MGGTMPKTPALPDHARAHFGYRQEHFSRDACVELALRYGFKKTYDLYRCLNDAAMWLDIFRDPGDAPIPVRRHELEVLQTRARALLESLWKLGHHSRVALTLHDPKQGAPIDTRSLSLQLQKLDWAIRNSLADLPQGRVGAPRKELEAVVAAELRKVYVEGTGKRDIVKKVSRDPERFGGEWFEFFCHCMQSLRLVKGQKQLQRLAKRAEKSTPSA